MPSAGAIPRSNAEPGKIKLRDNDNDKSNICAIKDQQYAHSPPGTANAGHHAPKVKVKCKSRDCVIYLSLAGFILFLCLSALFIGLWYGHSMYRASSEEANIAAVFRRHLTSDDSVEEIRRITRSVIQEEMPIR